MREMLQSSPLRINVVEPQRSCNATVVVKDWRLSNFKTKVPEDSTTEESSSSDTSNSDDEESSTPKDSFFRALNLAPASLDPGARGQWPLRHLSRVSPGIPLCDLTPLSCGAGRRHLRPGSTCEKASRAAVSKYEGLCVASGLPDPSHARLRCRRVAYPVCTTGKTLQRAESTHVYSFGRRQRLERLKVIETGLDRRSRRLLAQCRDCRVQLERVSKEEIKRWKTLKRSKQRPKAFTETTYGTHNLPKLSVLLTDVMRRICTRDGHYYLSGTRIRVLNCAEFLAARPPLRQKNEQIPVIDLTSDSPPRKQQQQASRKGKQNHAGGPARQRNPPSRSSSTQLHVASQVLVGDDSLLLRAQQMVAQKQSGLQQKLLRNSVQVVGNSLLRRPQLTVRNSVQRQCRETGNSLVQQEVARSRQLPTQQSHESGNSLVRREAARPRQLPTQQSRESSNSLVRREVARPRQLPTQQSLESGNSLVRREVARPRQLPTHFRCFACGCNRYISGDARSEVQEHMRLFHSVSEPDRFLTVYRDQVKRCTIVEAFPGYKGAND